MRIGLVPLVADASTKTRRELFVGNTPTGTTERALIDHVNAAMVTAKMCLQPGPPVISCRVSPAFAFIELRSIEETDRCLSLTGLPFMGATLKVGRPSKYEGPMTTASNWGQVVLELGEMDKPSTASANLLRAGGVDMSGTVPENEKSKRELFIGNVPAGADEESLRSLLVLVATQVGLLASGGSPLVSLRLSGHYAFIEVRSAIEASSLLRISGVPFCGTRLRISRPTKYQDASLSRRDDDSLGLTWTDTLEEYRASVPQFRSLDSDKKSSPPLRPLSLDVVTRLAILTDAPTNALVLRNVLQTARADSANVNAAADEIIKDLHTEASKFGAVLGVVPYDADDLKVDFSLVDDAILAMANFKFMRFCNQAIDVHFHTQPLSSPPPSNCL